MTTWERWHPCLPQRKRDDHVPDTFTSQVGLLYIPESAEMETLRIQLVPHHQGADQQPFHVTFTMAWNHTNPTGEFELPYSPNDIEVIRRMLHQRVLRPGIYHLRVHPDNRYTDEQWDTLQRCDFVRPDNPNLLIDDPLRQIGETLYECLFADKPASELLQRFLQDRAEGCCQVVFVFYLSRKRGAGAMQALMGLPWEVLWEPGAIAPLCIHQNVMIVRCCQEQAIANHKPLSLQKPIPILPLVPTRGSHDPTYLECAEQANPQHSCRSHDAWCRLIENHTAGVTRDTLRQHIQTHRPHILHYFGHGDLTEQGFTFLIDNPGHAYAVRSFWYDVRDHTIQLLVSFACFSGKTSMDPLRSIPSSLADTLPAMLLMQTMMPMRAAGEAGAVFYRQLAEGASVVQAVQAVRNALYEPTDSTIPDNAWWIPTLYLRYPNKPLFFVVKVRGSHPPPPDVSYSAFQGHVKGVKQHLSDQGAKLQLVADILLALAVPITDDQLYTFIRTMPSNITPAGFRYTDVEDMIRRLEPYIGWDDVHQTSYLPSEELHREWYTENQPAYRAEVTDWIRAWQASFTCIGDYPDALLHVLAHPTHRQHIEPLPASPLDDSRPLWRRDRPYQLWRELTERYVGRGLTEKLFQLIAYRLEKQPSNLDRAVLEYMHDRTQRAQDILMENRTYLARILIGETPARLRMHLRAETEYLPADQIDEQRILRLTLDLLERPEQAERAQTDHVMDTLVQDLMTPDISDERGFILRFILVPLLWRTPDTLQTIIERIRETLQPTEQLHLGIALALVYRGTTLPAGQALLQHARNWLREQRQTQAPTRRMLLLFTALLSILNTDERRDIAAFLLPLLDGQSNPGPDDTLNDTDFSPVEWLVYEVVLRQCAELQSPYIWSDKVSKPHAEAVQLFVRETVEMSVAANKLLDDRHLMDKLGYLRDSFSQSTGGYELHALAAMLRSLQLLDISMSDGLPDTIQHDIQKQDDLLTRAVVDDRCVIATLAPWFSDNDNLRNAIRKIIDGPLSDLTRNAWLLTMLAEEPDAELRKLWFAVLLEQSSIQAAETSRLELEIENPTRFDEVIAQENFNHHRQRSEMLRTCSDEEFVEWQKTAIDDIFRIFTSNSGTESLS